MIMKKQDWVQQQAIFMMQMIHTDSLGKSMRTYLTVCVRITLVLQKIMSRSIMKQGGVVLAMGKKKMSRAVIQLSLGVDVVGNLLWLAVGVAMGLSVGVDVVCN